MTESLWSLDRLPVGIWVARVPDGVVVYTNRAFQEILGSSPSPGASIDEAPVVYGIFDRAGQPYPVDRLPFSRVVATGNTVEVDDLVIHRPDGRRAFVRALAAPSLDGAGNVTHVTVAFSDISRELETESHRATLQSQLELAVNHAPIAIFSIERSGMITLSEGAGLAALGVRSGELVGTSVFDVYRDHPTIAGYIRRGLAGESLSYTVAVGAATYDTWLSPQRDGSGEVVAVNGVSTDVSELRKLQAAAIQSDRVAALGALAASVAHEINNPLTYVLASLDMLKRALDRHGILPEVAGHLATTRTGLDRIAGITSDLRTFSRPGDTRREPLMLADAVHRLLGLMGKEVEARATLRLELGPTPLVMANEARLVQVAMNLLMNALDAATSSRGANARVEITTRGEDGHAVLEVADNGPGVAPAERERIFEPFVTSKPVGEGTGLGLFVCRNLVQELGGRLSIHDRPGGGPVFKVMLPGIAGRVVSPSADEGEPAPAGGQLERVLVIDDEPLIGQALVGALRDAGYAAETITDGAVALERLLAGASFDLVLCDLMMPGTTGMDIAEALARRAPEILQRFVFMTGGAFTSRATRFLESVGRPVVAKPFDPVTEVRRLLRR